MSMDKLIALVPAYCPEKSMIKSVEELSHEFPAVVIVDDGCSEDYAPVFDAVRPLPGVVILKHPENRGKGCALKTGFKYILDNHPDALGVVTLDADGQHTVKDTLHCCEKFLENTDSIVFGCRDFESDEKIPPRSRFGNRLTSRLMKFFCDIKLSDTQTGLRVIPATALKELVEVGGELGDRAVVLHPGGIALDRVDHVVGVLLLELVVVDQPGGKDVLFRGDDI